MRVIYIDELFLFNAAVDYLLLFSTEKLCGQPGKFWRNAVAAALGGGYAAFSRCRMGELLSLPGLKVSFAAVMVACAWGRQPVRRFVRCFAVFLLSSALLGGVTVAAAGLWSGSDASGFAVVPRGASVLLMGAAGSILCATELSGAGYHGKESFVKLEITFLGRTACCIALVDSGNTLRDPLSGLPVIIAETEVLSELWDGKIARAAERAADGPALLSALGETSYLTRFRLVPCETALGSGMLAAFRPDKVLVAEKEKAVLVALYPGKLGEGGRFRALVGPTAVDS